MHEANIRMLEANYRSDVNEISGTDLITADFSRNIMQPWCMPANKDNLILCLLIQQLCDLASDLSFCIKHSEMHQAKPDTSSSCTKPDTFSSCTKPDTSSSCMKPDTSSNCTKPNVHHRQHETPLWTLQFSHFHLHDFYSFYFYFNLLFTFWTLQSRFYGKCF